MIVLHFLEWATLRYFVTHNTESKFVWPYVHLIILQHILSSAMNSWVGPCGVEKVQLDSSMSIHPDMS